MVMMENGYCSSPRIIDTFPAGLRVLVVDDDPTWLKILEKMLKKCSYDVTTCGLAREALRLLRDRKDGFDIVISDVNMPDMDGFRLLEHVGLEMDLPVIMMSVDGETSRVMKGVQHGACDYLLKPIRMKELKNIWQHVVRKRLHEVRDIEFFDDRDQPNDGGYYGGDPTLLKKRKDVENEKESCDPSSSKKARVVWSIELHQKFVKAVNQIGIDSDKVGPKKILDMMNVPWLTRENVASHLQKYRLYLSRIGKGEDNMESSFGLTKNNPEFSPKESDASISIQNSSFTLQNDVTSKPMYPAQSSECKSISRKPKKSTEHKKAFNNENSDPQTFQSVVNYTSLDSPVSGSWQFKHERKPVESILQQKTQPDHLEPVNTGLSISEQDWFSTIEVKPQITKQNSNVGQISPLESALITLSGSNLDELGCVFDEPAFSLNKLDVNLELKNLNQPQASIVGHGHDSVNGSENGSRKPVIGPESAFGFLGEDLLCRWFQVGDAGSQDFGVDNVGFSDSNFAQNIDEVTFPKFGLEYEYPYDWVEYPAIDQGLLFS